MEQGTAEFVHHLLRLLRHKGTLPMQPKKKLPNLRSTLTQGSPRRCRVWSLDVKGNISQSVLR